MTTTFVPPPVTHRASSFFHPHLHHSTSTLHSQSSPNTPKIFEGTDAVPQNQKVALQRIVEVHDALERKNSQDQNPANRHDSAELSVDSLNTNFDIVDLPHAEVRAFKYFLRLWDQQHHEQDLEFDDIVKQNKLNFEETAIKHFFRRVALWHESEELLEAAKMEKRKRFHWNSVDKDTKDEKLSKLWQQERARQEHAGHAELKKVTTREGLAQLLWTLMHDHSAPLAPELFIECTNAVKRSYGIKC